MTNGHFLSIVKVASRPTIQNSRSRRKLPEIGPFKFASHQPSRAPASRRRGTLPVLTVLTRGASFSSCKRFGRLGSRLGNVIHLATAVDGSFDTDAI